MGEKGGDKKGTEKKKEERDRRKTEAASSEEGQREICLHPQEQEDWEWAGLVSLRDRVPR